MGPCLESTICEEPAVWSCEHALVRVTSATALDSTAFVLQSENVFRFEFH